MIDTSKEDGDKPITSKEVEQFLLHSRKSLNVSLLLAPRLWNSREKELDRSENMETTFFTSSIRLLTHQCR